MFDLFILRKARNDLRKIKKDTLKDWGEDQAEHYLGEIDARLEKLQHFPESGRACDEVRRGYRKEPVGRHIIFYYIEKETIIVSRILHQKRDFKPLLERS